jgi:hypothetical protein
MSVVHQSQPAAPNREIPIMSASRVPALVPMELISKCRNRLDAIRLCVQLSGYSNETLSERLGIDKSHWTRMMQGRASFPDTKSVDLMYLCGNCAPTQYEAWALSLSLKRENIEEEIARREAELARLKQMRTMSTGVHLAAAA